MLKKKFACINDYAVSIITYRADIVDWIINEINELDRKNRKLFTMHNAQPPKQKETGSFCPGNGKWRLKTMKDAIGRGVKDLAEYVCCNKKADTTVKFRYLC